jgi:hypothetical protein
MVVAIQRHASSAHGMALTRDEALLLSRRAELGASPTASRERRELGNQPKEEL